MTRRAGRPPKGEGERAVRQIRVMAYIADMIADLTLVLPAPRNSSAVLTEPLLAPEITRLHEQYKTQIDQAKAAQKTADEALERARREAEELATRQQTRGSTGPRKPKPGS